MQSNAAITQPIFADVPADARDAPEGPMRDVYMTSAKIWGSRFVPCQLFGLNKIHATSLTFVLTPLAPSVQTSYKYPPEGRAPGRDRAAVRGGRLETPLPPRKEHGATRLRGVPQVR